MTRVNLVHPRRLADQHLIAEYYEILGIAGHARKHPGLDRVPARFTLGEGHVRFFKDKLGYLAERHERIREEMRRRGFAPRVRFSLAGFSGKQRGSWRPTERDARIVRQRMLQRIRAKPSLYTYVGERRSLAFWRRLAAASQNAARFRRT